MDHMLELARHPDLREALRRLADVQPLTGLHALKESPPESAAGVADSACLLSAKEFLATENPNAWVAEAVHAFYDHPQLAARVWAELRYCRNFCRELAEKKLRDEAKRWWHRLFARLRGRSISALAKRYLQDPQKAVREFAKVLHGRPKCVDQLCESLGAYPEPPAFIRDLVDSEKPHWRPDERERRICALLADPQEVRQCAGEKGIPVPFSLVQEQELEQICRTRDEIGRPPAGDLQSMRFADENREEAPGSHSPLSYQGSPYSERARRKRRLLRRGAMDKAESDASKEVMAGHSTGKYPHHSARVAMDMNLLGLAFSGGGIRSATFNLGVLQGLSRLGLLRYVDYLSTVSGGGYIGSWLAAWIRRDLDEERERRGSRGAVKGLGDRVMTDTERRLSPVRSPNPLDQRLRPIRFLREYSNYLTPRTGFFSADTWTMAGIYVRNTLLNQVIIAALFATILLVPRNWMPLASYLHHNSWLSALCLATPMPGAALPPLDVPLDMASSSLLRIALWTGATILLLLNLRQLDPRHGTAIAGVDRDPLGTPTPRGFAHPWAIHAGVAVPWLLIAAVTAQPAGEWAITGEVGHYRSSVWVAIVVAATMAIVLLGGRADRCWARSGKRSSSRGSSSVKTWFRFWSRGGTHGSSGERTSFGFSSTGGNPGGSSRETWVRFWQTTREQFSGLIVGAPAIAGSAAMAGLVAGGLWWLFIGALPARLATSPTELAWHLNALGTPALMFAVSLAIVVMLGMLGERFPDEHREWWSRLRTVTHYYAVGWLVWFLAAIYVPWGIAVLAAKGFGIKWGISAIAAWAGSTLLGVRQGPKAEAEQKRDSDQTVPPGFWTIALRWGVFIAPYVFVIGVVLGVSVAIDAVYAHNAPTHLRPVTAYWELVSWTTTTCLLWTGVCALVALVFSWRVDINEFSIHHFYKNRLVRCYLGASHTDNRKPDWFTGFDPKDDLPLRRFDCNDATTPYVGPYPIVNCALNLVGGKDLAWQERKATSFVFTPKYCGYDVDRSVLTKGCEQHSDGFVQTSSFYNTDGGPLLGMATAVSGAAANPNMGRASSPALGFLMTVFNVRLGWWIGNPRHRDGRTRRSPQLGLIYTFAELFGMTDDQRRFVNLSDGGHFDNLGVYELIRRNCRYIVVCDAGQDDQMVCEDLGTLIRRCRMDFGVEIDIAVDRIRQRDAGRSQAHCVVGTIKYLNMPLRVGGNVICEDGSRLTPGARPAYETGYLVYIKPTLTGDEPQDVLEYARRSARFPHQSTANQWFAESQFESYRALGMHIAEQTFARYKPDDTYQVANLDDLFENLYLHWHPPSANITDRSTEHAAEYSRIMEVVRSQLGLQGLDATLFDTVMSRAQPALSPRDEFYVCNALIQLMENVYADLDLESNWAHPHVRGWMEIFSTWVGRESFKRTWGHSRNTYAGRFRSFYENRLEGRGAAAHGPKEIV